MSFRVLAAIALAVVALWPLAGCGPPGAGQSSASQDSNGSPSKSEPAIKLSAGVALPQTLPDGTQVGVSVDYRVKGKLNSSARHVWVIASQAGETSIDVKLDAKGTLQGFLPIEVRPEHGPFRARIDEHAPDASPVTVSNVLLLQ